MCLDYFIRDGLQKTPSGQVHVFVLFVWGFSTHSKSFNSFGDVTITGEGLQILTFTPHSWPLSSEGSLTCHIYCDTGQPFIVVISEDSWHSQLLSSDWQWNCHYLGLSRPVIEPRSPACEANALPIRHRTGAGTRSDNSTVKSTAKGC